MRQWRRCEDVISNCAALSLAASSAGTCRRCLHRSAWSAMRPTRCCRPARAFQTGRISPINCAGAGRSTRSRRFASPSFRRSPVGVAHRWSARGRSAAVGADQARLRSADELAPCRRGGPLRRLACSSRCSLELCTARACAGTGCLAARRVEETPEPAGEVCARLRRSRDGDRDRERRPWTYRCRCTLKRGRARHPQADSNGSSTRRHRRSGRRLVARVDEQLQCAGCAGRSSREHRWPHCAGVRARAGISDGAAPGRRSRRRLGCNWNQRRPPAQQLAATDATRDCRCDRAHGRVAALRAVRAYSSACVHGSDWTVTTTVERLAPDEGGSRWPEVVAGRIRAHAGLQVGEAGVSCRCRRARAA